MQMQSAGEPMDPANLEAIQRGDLLFWKGHVAIAQSPDWMVHASGYHMEVVVEPIRRAIERTAETHGPLIAILRPVAAAAASAQQRVPAEQKPAVIAQQPAGRRAAAPSKTAPQQAATPPAAAPVKAPAAAQAQRAASPHGRQPPPPSTRKPPQPQKSCLQSTLPRKPSPPRSMQAWRRDKRAGPKSQPSLNEVAAQDPGPVKNRSRVSSGGCRRRMSYRHKAFPLSQWERESRLGGCSGVVQAD